MSTKRQSILGDDEGRRRLRKRGDESGDSARDDHAATDDGDELASEASLLPPEELVAVAEQIVGRDGARAVPHELTIDPEVTVYADAAADDEDPLLRRMTSDPAHSPKLSAGDLDAAWDAGDSGEESVGGTMPTPDQDNVDEVGEAAGVEFQDNEPLDIGDKLGRRDTRRWELDPASAEDYEERAREIARNKHRR
jgi:hypothetical protein